MGTVIKHSDRFVETYYTERWFNFFEIHDHDDRVLKGWYCTVARPAVMESDTVISYLDLALDLWVAPDGTQTVLDEDKVAALDLDQQTCHQARAAVGELPKFFVEK